MLDDDVRENLRPDAIVFVAPKTRAAANPRSAARTGRGRNHVSLRSRWVAGRPRDVRPNGFGIVTPPRRRPRARLERRLLLRSQAGWPQRDLPAPRCADPARPGHALRASLWKAFWSLPQGRQCSGKGSGGGLPSDGSTASPRGGNPSHMGGLVFHLQRRLRLGVSAADARDHRRGRDRLRSASDRELLLLRGPGDHLVRPSPAVAVPDLGDRERQSRPETRREDRRRHQPHYSPVLGCQGPKRSLHLMRRRRRSVGGSAERPRPLRRRGVRVGALPVVPGRLPSRAVSSATSSSRTPRIIRRF